MDHRGINDVVIVEDEHNLAGARDDLSGEDFPDRLDGGDLGSLKERQHFLAKAGVQFLKCSDHIGQEAGRVVVV